MTTENDSVKLEFLCRTIRSIEDQLKVLPDINAQLERSKLQDEHFKENQARMQGDINRIWNKFDEHIKDDRSSFDLLSDKLNTLDARPGKIALNRWERIGISVAIVIVLGLGSSWINLQKLEVQEKIVAAREKKVG